MGNCTWPQTWSLPLSLLLLPVSLPGPPSLPPAPSHHPKAAQRWGGQSCSAEPDTDVSAPAFSIPPASFLGSPGEASCPTRGCTPSTPQLRVRLLVGMGQDQGLAAPLTAPEKEPGKDRSRVGAHPQQALAVCTGKGPEAALSQTASPFPFCNSFPSPLLFTESWWPCLLSSLKLPGASPSLGRGHLFPSTCCLQGDEVDRGMLGAKEEGDRDETELCPCSL